MCIESYSSILYEYKGICYKECTNGINNNIPVNRCKYIYIKNF